jgi:hypothetical protein
MGGGVTNVKRETWGVTARDVTGKQRSEECR